MPYNSLSVHQLDVLVVNKGDTDKRFLSRYSEWGMRGWSVLGSVPFMGTGVFISLSSWLTG